MPKRFDIATFDERHQRHLAKKAKEVEALYIDAINKIAAAAQSALFTPGEEFSWDDFPLLKKKTEELLKETTKRLELSITEGDKESWRISSEKNDAMVDDILRKTKLPPELVKEWKAPNLNAMNSFIERKTAGMNLSERVWNLGEQFKGELELAMEVCLGQGKSAAEISREVRQYLNNPDKLFRRVRDEKGVLRLSKAAKAYHPGRGVYRSSYKNALRLSATENNIAYRTADHTRWQQLPFVVGIEIKLSNNHTLNGQPFHDICDELIGIYPKGFKFTGWHPFCRCIALAKLCSQDEMDKYANAIADDEDVTNWKFKGEVKKLPDCFTAWLDDNKERVKTTTSVPYFIKDNPAYVPKKWVDGIGSIRKTRSKGILTDIKETFFKLKEPTFVTEKEVRSMILNYSKAYPGDFYGHLKAIKISKNGNGKTMMENIRSYYKTTGKYAKSEGNILTIYNEDLKVTTPSGDKDVFNPLHELKGAMKAIAANKRLTFNQEYAIESLWHEIRHAGAIGWEDIRKQTEELTAAMECINQFCARRSYGKFLHAIGGSVSHKKEIIKSGYGYNKTVRHFEEMLAALSVSSSEAYAHFSKMIMVEPYENIFGNIVQFLVGKGVDKKKAEMLVTTLRRSDDVFGKVLTGV